ncbi:unnamed protein product, partial [Gulo gulo]
QPLQDVHPGVSFDSPNRPSPPSHLRARALSQGVGPELGAPRVARGRDCRQGATVGLSLLSPRIPEWRTRAPPRSSASSRAGCLGLSRSASEEIIGNKIPVAMASSDVKPKSISRAKKWSDEIENLYRFQQAGYRDEIEYKQVKHVSMVDRWPETGYVKKLQRRDNTFYYYNKQRECDDKEVHKVKIYAY